MKTSNELFTKWDCPLCGKETNICPLVCPLCFEKLMNKEKQLEKTISDALNLCEDCHNIADVHAILEKQLTRARE